MRNAEIEALWEQIKSLKIEDFLVLRRRMNSAVKRDLMSLPLELILKILTFLKVADLLRLLMVNKLYNSSLSNSNTTWKHAFINEGYKPVIKTGVIYKKVLMEKLKIKRNWENAVCSAKLLDGHRDVVYCLQYSFNTLITGSRDNTCKVWDCDSGICKKTLVGHSGSVLCLQFEDGLLITGSSDSTIILWDYYTGGINGTLSGHTQSVLNLQFDVERDILVSCSKDKTVKVRKSVADI